MLLCPCQIGKGVKDTSVVCDTGWPDIVVCRFVDEF